MRYTLEQLNFAPADAFVAALSSVFEHSPWVAAAVVRERPFPNVDALHRSMARVVERAGEAKQLALINAHPELACKALAAVPQRTRGEASREPSREISAESTREQRGAGLTECTHEEIERLQSLNRRYRETFGFTFILAVRDYDREGIIANFEARVNHSRAHELRANLDQIYRIARWRLADLIET